MSDESDCGRGATWRDPAWVTEEGARVCIVRGRRQPHDGQQPGHVARDPAVVLTAPWEKPSLLISQFCRTFGPSRTSFTSISLAPGGFLLAGARGGLCEGFFSLPQVYENLQVFMEDEGPGDDLLDRLTVSLGGSERC